MKKLIRLGAALLVGALVLAGCATPLSDVVSGQTYASEDAGVSYAFGTNGTVQIAIAGDVCLTIDGTYTINPLAGNTFTVAATKATEWKGGASKEYTSIDDYVKAAVKDNENLSAEMLTKMATAMLTGTYAADGSSITITDGEGTVELSKGAAVDPKTASVQSTGGTGDETTGGGVILAPIPPKTKRTKVKTTNSRISPAKLRLSRGGAFFMPDARLAGDPALRRA